MARLAASNPRQVLPSAGPVPRCFPSVRSGHHPTEQSEAVDAEDARLRRGVSESGCGGAGAKPGWGDVGTVTPMGSLVLTVMAAPAQMEIKRERITDSVAKRRAA